MTSSLPRGKRWTFENHLSLASSPVPVYAPPASLVVVLVLVVGLASSEELVSIVFVRLVFVSIVPAHIHI